MHGQRMDGVVRKWQAATLWDEYEMSRLAVLRENLTKSFDERVLATYVHQNILFAIMH
jgi:histone deacetylase 6